MKRKALSPSLALAAAALLASVAAAEIPRFSARADLVVLSATAVDHDGRPIRDLKREELRIFDQGRPQRLVHFAASGDLKARILLLVDASGSMNAPQKSANARMATVQILAALHPEDEAALAGFDSRYFGVVPFTRDRNQILQGFAELTPFGTTALHDALEKAASDLASHGEGRRAVIVVTDGVDTASQKTAEEAIAASRALGVPIYTVSVVSPLDDPRSPLFAGSIHPGAAATGAAVLDRYARLSGGAAFTVSDFRGLKLAADRIAGELKHQYRLGYDPPAGPPGFRRIEVRTTRKGVVIRTRNGYMPP